MRVLPLALVGLLVLGGASESLAQDDVRAAAFIGLARVHRDQGDMAAAARDFDQAASHRPLTVAEKGEYFWILRAVDPRRALDLGREILQTTPADDDLRDGVIAAAVSLKDESTVVALAQDGQRSSKDSARWWRRLAESHLRAGHVADAADAYQQAADSASGQPSDRLAAATMLTSAGRYPEALAAWRQVPAALIADKPGPAKLRLLAVARSASPSETAAEIMAWQQANAFDADVQSWLVDAWIAARNYSAAYAAARPLTSGPDADKWLRRSGELARRAGLEREAAAAYESLVRSPRSTRADRILLIGVLLEQGATDRALAAVDPLLATLQRCDDDVLAIADRIPDAVGTDRLRAATTRLGCLNSRWGQRIAERAVAEGRFQVALETLDALSASQPDIVRLRGQLQLWTGSPSAAAATLQPFVSAYPDDIDARLALVDALRALKRPADAFIVATPLFASRAVSADRMIGLAELALEAGQAALADGLVAGLTDTSSPAGKAILGRALLAQGKAAEAASVLSSMPVSELPPPAAAALIDAVLTTRGFAAAQPVADQFTAVDLEWRDVATRRVTIGLVTGAGDVAELRQRLCTTDSTACARAEADALRVLAADWQKTHAPATLDRLTTMAALSPDDADARVTVAGALLDAGQAERALALLPADAGTLPDSGRTVLARTLTQLSAAEHQRGNQHEAIALGRRAVSQAPAFAPAWFATFDAAIELGRDEVTAVVAAFQPVAAADPALLVSVGDHIAGVVQGQREWAVKQIVAMLQTAPASADVAPKLTEARLYAALEDWTPALDAVDAELQRRPDSRDAMRLRADVLGWSGQHAAAIDAYDAYLEAVPSDVDAQRQQARVAGWAGRYNEANRRYVLLTRRYPDNHVVAAEAAAKKAFYAEHWQQAVKAYDAWIRLEPDNSEARFERALSLRASGQPMAADSALSDLALQTGHRMATVALTQSEEARHPAVTIASDYKSADGYGGARLLSMQQQHAGAVLPVGNGSVARVSFSAGQARAESDAQSQAGFRGTAGTQLALSPHVGFDGSAGVWSFSSKNAVEARFAGTWHSDDRVAITGGVQQQAIHENLSTVDSGLTGRGPFAGLRLASSNGSFETAAAWQRLSDGNSRREITLSAGRVVSERLRSVRLIAWGQTLGYSSQRSYYFSPASFLRLDGGAEYAKLLQRPRFAGDRQSSLALSFVEGTDNHGVLYHHPAVRLHWQLSRRVALNGNAELIRSSTYHETLLFVGFDMADLAKHR